MSEGESPEVAELKRLIEEKQKLDPKKTIHRLAKEMTALGYEVFLVARPRGTGTLKDLVIEGNIPKHRQVEILELLKQLVELGEIEPKEI